MSWCIACQSVALVGGLDRRDGDVCFCMTKCLRPFMKSAVAMSYTPLIWGASIVFY